MWDIVKSVLSAMLGVHPANAAHKDFSQTKLWPYVLVGVIFILIFIASLGLVIQIILKQTALA